ncbi:MAG: hypothetical protein K6U80_03895 [Firmicutes bacterium]|nr:hypothetical protein [Bacillota bacterium]
MNYDLLVFFEEGRQGIDFDIWTEVLSGYFLDFKLEDEGKRKDEKAKKLIQDLPKMFEEYRNILTEFELDRLPDISGLPLYSLLLHFEFTLAKPYLSRDDKIVYPTDNPLRKDKVFKLPMIAPSAWKGNLRAAVNLMNTGKDNKDEVIARLFGSREQDDGGDLKHGRLLFYPTFFTDISREIINPHDRKKKAGKIPINFEAVPAGEQGKFTLLYVPYLVLCNISPASEEFRKQVKEDIEVLFCGIPEMMLAYGFSAKKTSGYGAARDELKLPGKIEFCLVKEESRKEFWRISDLPKLTETIWPSGGGN